MKDTKDTKAEKPAPQVAPQTNGPVPPKAPARRGIDPEIQALARLDRIMAELTPEQAERAVAWLESRYGNLLEHRFTLADVEQE